MDKIVNLSLARKSVPTYIDVVQSATAPDIVFVLDDYMPPSNARARLYIKKTNAEVYNSCTISGNQVIFSPTAGSFDEEGQCVAQLQITVGSSILVSWRIFVTVEPNLIEGSAGPASTEYGALEDLIINAQQYDTIIGANNITGYNNRQGWTALANGQNIDALIESGVYSANTNAIAASLTTTPFNYTFKLVVEKIQSNSNNYVIQTATRTSTGEERKRVSINSGSTWTEWQTTPLRAEVDAIANLGAKNILKRKDVTATRNGITVTVNEDGSVTANGTATANAQFDLWTRGTNDWFLKANTYRLTGCPEGGSGSTYELALIKTTSGGGSTVVTRDYGSGANFTVTNESESYGAYIMIRSGQTVNNLTFFPMLRVAAIQDDTYEPYAMTNAELSYDTGWVDLTDYLIDTYLAIRPSYTPSVRRVGKHVFFRGQVYIANSGGSGNMQVFNAIPSEFRPSLQVGWSGSTYQNFTPFYGWITTGGGIFVRPQSYDVQGNAQGFDLSLINYVVG